MSPSVVHGSGGPAPTALLCAKRLWEVVLPPLPRVGERQIGQHSDPRPSGTFRQPRYDPGDGTVDPRKEFSFLVNGSWDHGSESIERRWSLLPGQRRFSTPWGRFTLPMENPGEHFPRWLARTKNRSRSPGPRASGLWNNVAKGSRQNGGVTWEEALALRAGLGGGVLHFPSDSRAVGLLSGGPVARAFAKLVCPRRLGCKQPP